MGFENCFTCVSFTTQCRGWDAYICAFSSGKSTLVKEVANDITKKAKEIANDGAEHMFDEVVMVEISEVPNIERIQDQIAEQIELRLDNVHSLHERATMLYNSIKQKEVEAANKRYKILIILDNIWEKLDLSKVGIPQPNENSDHFCCKLILTSRMKDVCGVMSASNSNIFEVHPLDEEEARQLFRARVGVEGKDESMEDKMLKMCGGLPLSIVALADVLRNQELSTWGHYATELEQPISSHGIIRGVNRATYSILETSYRLMESEEKKKFFLLACLFPFGARIAVDDMMRYGIGLGLFQNVNNLTEAMEQATTWADELKKSSLLLEDDTQLYDRDRKGHVKIHDVVRASTISLAETGGDKFMVEALPRWMCMETYEKYSAISLIAGTDHSRLHGLKSDKLETLILDGTQPGEFYETFSQHMTNLKVLVLKGMKACVYGLHNSVQERQELKSSLRTLHLENCELLDIRGIGTLINLVVLSLRGSIVQEIPVEMRELNNLRLLDLRLCKIATQRIPPDVLHRLSQLEGLYLYSAVKYWAHDTGVLSSIKESDGAEGGSTSTKREYNNYAKVDELNRLRYLNVIEMQVELGELPNDDQFVNNLDQFDVLLVSDDRQKGDYITWYREWSRSLEVAGLDVRRVMEKKSAKALLLKTEQLILEYNVGLDHCLMQGESGKIEVYSVKDLIIRKSSLEKKHVEDGINWSAFPKVEKLSMWDVNIKSLIGHHPQTQGGGSSGKKNRHNKNNRIIFPPKLQCLELEDLKELEGYVVPIDLLSPNLTFLSVKECPELKYIFGEAESSDNTNAPNNLPSLKYLCLKVLPELKSIMVEAEVPNSSSASPTPFFNTQLKFEALEEVELQNLDSMVKVWDMMPWFKDITDVGCFPNFKSLYIQKCKNLEMLCPLSIANGLLVHLKYLSIWGCDKVREAIKGDGGSLESDGGVTTPPTLQQQPLSLLFPSLETLWLVRCDNMLSFISSPEHNNILPVIEFPSLHTLIIRNCHEMQSFSAGGDFTAPKLTRFEYDEVVQQTDDINQFLTTRYRERNNISEVQQ